MLDIKTQLALDELKNGGGILYPFRNGYEKLSEILTSITPETWRYDETVLGGLVLHLVKQGQAARAKSYLRARNLKIQKTYQFEFLELMVALHLGEKINENQITVWRRLERKLPLQDTLLIGLYYNVMMAMFVRIGNLEDAKNAGQQAISCFREEGHSYLEHFIHIHLADLDVIEGRLIRAMRGLSTAKRCLTNSGLSYGNEVEVIEIIELAILYERGEFEKVRKNSARLRESLLKGDSWSELFLQLTRISVLSLYFTKGFQAAQEELEIFQADYVRRHAERASTIDILSSMIWRLEWNTNEAELYINSLTYSNINSAIGRILFSDQHIILNEKNDLKYFSPRGEIIDELQIAHSESGKKRRDALERAFRNALKENQIAPFLENRDTFLGISGQVASISSIKRNPIMLRFVNKIMKAVSKSYAIPEFLRKIGFNRKQFMVSAALQAGSTNKQIARQLGIKEATVKYHLTKMYKIAKVSKRSELIDFINENKNYKDI